ncbi:unnamed protein product [Rhodiola kirilowii]
MDLAHFQCQQRVQLDITCVIGDPIKSARPAIPNSVLSYSSAGNLLEASLRRDPLRDGPVLACAPSSCMLFSRAGLCMLCSRTSDDFAPSVSSIEIVQLQAGVRTSSSPFGTCIGVRLTRMMLISSTPKDGPWMDPIQTKQTKISVTCLLEEDRGNALGTCSLQTRQLDKKELC